MYSFCFLMYIFLLQESVNGAFWPTFLPIEHLQGNCLPAVFQKIQTYTGRNLNPGPWGLEHSALNINMSIVNKCRLYS